MITRSSAEISACRLPVRVYFEDTDAGGIVYHAAYLKFMERARTEWLRALGFEQDHVAREFRVLFVVKNIAIDYISPARFNDVVEVITQVQRVGRASIEFQQDIVKEAQILTKAFVRVACIDAERLRPSKMPQALFTEMNHATR